MFKPVISSFLLEVTRVEMLTDIHRGQTIMSDVFISSGYRVK